MLNLMRQKSRLLPNSKSTNDEWTRYQKFEILYDKHAPKAYGFIMKYVNSKEKAEEVLINVFVKIWDEIKDCSLDDEKKIISSLLTACRPIYKNKVHNGNC